MTRREEKNKSRLARSVMLQTIATATHKIEQDIETSSDVLSNKKRAEAIYYLSAAFQLME